MKLVGILLIILSAQIAHCFVVPLEWGAKCVGADAIVRGVVVDVVLLTKEIDDSGGHRIEKNVDEDFAGPHAVAILRVTDVMKGSVENYPSVMFIPCGYDYDESPAELTKSKDYILFLRHMGGNYFSPLDPFSMHRVQVNRVAKIGFDTGSSFKKENMEAGTVQLAEFTAQIAEALQVATDHEEKRKAHWNRRQEGEAGSGQAATGYKSDSESGGKPQPEAEESTR